MVWLAVWGCVEPEPAARPPAPEPETGPSSTDPTAETGTPSTADTTSTADTAAETFDCTGIPSTGTPIARHEYVSGFEDFTFDAEGYLWGADAITGDLVRIPHGGPPELLRPAIAACPRGTRFLTDGDLAVVDATNGAVIRIDRTTFGSSLIAGSFQLPNGIAVAADGALYVTSSNGRVYRVDPTTGIKTPVIDSPTGTDGITFAPDYQRLYVGSDQVDGVFATFVVDADGEVTEPLSRVVDLPAAADGMTMDRCGNAYVVLIGNNTLERVQPDGTRNLYADLPGMTVTSVNFGSGVGGWERDHLYVSGFGGAMLEFDGGVEGKWEPQYP